MAMLEVKDLEVYYGVIQAIKGVSFQVNQGEVIALIGANGAGKTTILHTVTGLLSPKRGSVVFEGKEITKVPAHKIVSMGMAHVPEGRRVFAELSVYENLKMGAYTRKDKKEIEESLANVYKRFPRLEERKICRYYWHFAHFIEEGAVRIAHTKYTEKLDVTAWRNPSGEIVCILMNKADEKMPAVIRMEGGLCRISLEPRAIASCIIR